jgi:hypothetical protein
MKLTEVTMGTKPEVGMPEDSPQLRDLELDCHRLAVALRLFAAWQTNFPASRPELYDPMLAKAAEIQSLGEQLWGLRVNHPPTLELEKQVEAQEAWRNARTAAKGMEVGE